LAFIIRIYHDARSAECQIFSSYTNWKFIIYTDISLTLILLTWRIWWTSNNASRWQMGFNLAFKGL